MRNVFSPRSKPDSLAWSAEAHFAAAGLNAIATTIESDRATDLAIALSPTRLAVVRCVYQAKPEDHTALATMMAEGDFVWAGLVYGEREGSGAVGFVESFHLSELEQLAARLSALREAFDETR